MDKFDKNNKSQGDFLSKNFQIKTINSNIKNMSGHISLMSHEMEA